MSGMKKISAMRWTRERAALLAFVCLVIGVAGGWSIRALRSSVAVPASVAPAPVAGATATDSSAPQSPTPSDLKEMADAQAAPLQQKLRSDPSNPDLLSALGNLYYDAHQYPIALDYYARALKSKPDDAAVRTDMGTAFWFMGDADRAISEFNKALVSVPDNPNTLFNLGMVKWRGKKDAAGATAAWQKLLATTPSYEAKNKVEELLAEVKSQALAQPAAKAN